MSSREDLIKTLIQQSRLSFYLVVGDNEYWDEALRELAKLKRNFNLFRSAFEGGSKKLALFKLDKK